MRHRVCARYLVTLAGAIGALALPAAAQAGGSSPLHIDPNSPVAKAYALPISAARGAPPESGQTGAIFGAGISTTAGAPTSSSTCGAGGGSGRESGAHCTTTASSGGTPTTSTTSGNRTPATSTTSGNRTPTTSTTSGNGNPTTSTTSGNGIPPASTVIAPGTGDGIVWMAVAAAVVLALGLAGGAALHRRR